MRPVQPVFTVALLSRSGRYSHPLAQLVLGRKARQNRDCDSATVFLKLAAESGPFPASLPQGVDIALRECSTGTTVPESTLFRSMELASTERMNLPKCQLIS